MKILSSVVIFFLISVPNITSASDLKEIKLDDSGPGSVYLHYNPNLTKLLLTRDEEPGSGIFTLTLGEFQLSASNEETIVVKYFEGPSEDPGFIFFKKNKDQLTQLSDEIDGLHIQIPGNNRIYIWGHTNSYFNTRRIYKIENNKIVEIKQPYYYVGIEGKALTDLPIYESTAFKNQIDHIKKGDLVTIILNRKNHYLLKSKNGILGWWEPQKWSSFKAEEIEGFYYLGD